MLIDINANSVINAALAYINPSGLEGVAVGDGSDAITIGVVDGRLVANAAGAADVTISVYTPAGVLVATATGRDTASIDARQLSGVNIVRASTATAVKTSKIVIR